MRKMMLATASALALVASAGLATAAGTGDKSKVQAGTSAEYESQAGASAAMGGHGGMDGQTPAGLELDTDTQATAEAGAAAEANPQEWLGQSLVTAEGESVGEVSDVILSDAGNPEQVIVDHEGRQVAIDVSNVTWDENELRLSGMTQDEIASLPEFEYRDDMTALRRSGVTGSGEMGIEGEGEAEARPDAPILPDAQTGTESR